MLQAIQHRKGALRTGLTCCITGLCLMILSQHIATVDLADINTAIQGIGPWQWTLALCATAISFLAVGQYDVVWHRQLKTGVSGAQARSSGMAAIAVGQAVGLGAVTGTFVRWHLLKEHSLKSAAAVTIAVSVSFLICWGVYALVAASSLGLLTGQQAVILASIGGLVAYLILRRSADQTSKRGLMALLLLTGIDIVFAGTALWILIPTADASLFEAVILAYILALGAGLISNAPGGVGAFELVLLALLSTIPETAVLAGVLAFRIVYYIVPALLGGCLMLRAQLTKPAAALRAHAHDAAPISDLCHQGATLVRRGAASWVIRKHLLGTVAIEPGGSNPFWQRRGPGFRGLYKCGPRLAGQARAKGWQVRLIAKDAVILPISWTLDGSKRSGLRRKIRQAEKAGIRVTRAEATLPLVLMDAVAASWATQNKGELGYAMGRYTHAYVAHQQVYLIWQNQQLCGFATVQTRPQAWGLDLIRHLPNMPTGAMHLAIATIIADAQRAKVGQFSLGAVPAGPAGSRLQQHCAAKKAGLHQFKAGFMPHWVPLYHAAPSKGQWLLSMMHVCGHIQRPLKRLLGQSGSTITELIKKANIIHLPHIASSVIDQPTLAHERLHHDQCSVRSLGNP